MELLKISEVSDLFSISSRTLRYYEEIGIVNSIRKEDNQYRYYDEAALRRIRQIVILRKMQLSIADITAIFRSEDTTVLMEKFTEKLDSIDKEVHHLTELRAVIDDFLQKVKQSGLTSVSAVLSIDEQSLENLNQTNLIALPPITITQNQNALLAQITVEKDKAEEVKEQLFLFFEHSKSYSVKEDVSEIICQSDGQTVTLILPVCCKEELEGINNKSVRLISPQSLRYDDGTLPALCKDGTAEITAGCNIEGEYALPLQIDFDAKTDSTNIRMRFGQALFILNWECGKDILRLHEPITGTQHGFNEKGYVTENQWHHITWVLDKDYLSLLVDGEVRLCTCDLSYIRLFEEGCLQDLRGQLRLETEAGAKIELGEIRINEYEDSSRPADLDLTEQKRAVEEKALEQRKLCQSAQTLLDKVKINSSVVVDLANMKRTHGPAMRLENGVYHYRPLPSLPLTDGNLVFQEGAGEPFFHPQQFSLPVLVELDMKLSQTNEGNMMLMYGNTRFITLHQTESVCTVSFRDPYTIKKYGETQIDLKTDQYHKFSFLIDKDFIALFVDGEAKLLQTGMDYMVKYQTDDNFCLDMPFGIDTGWGVTISVREFTVHTLGPFEEKPQWIAEQMNHALQEDCKKEKENQKKLQEINVRCKCKKQHHITIAELDTEALKSDDKIPHWLIDDGHSGAYLYCSSNEHHVKTMQKWSGSLEIDLEVESPSNVNVMLCYGTAQLMLNGFFWNRSEMWLPDPNGQWQPLENAGQLSAGYNRIRWIIHQNFCALIINERVHFCFDHWHFVPYDQETPFKLYCDEPSMMFDYNFIKFKNLVIKELE